MKKFAVQLLESYARMSSINEVVDGQDTGGDVQAAIQKAVGATKDAPAPIQGGAGGQQTAYVFQTYNKREKVYKTYFKRDLNPKSWAKQVKGPGDNAGYDELQGFLSGEVSDDGTGTGSQDGLSARERELIARREEAISELNDIQPGLGDSLAARYDKATSFEAGDLFDANSNEEYVRMNKLHEQFFSNANYSLRSKMKRAAARERIFLEQFAEAEMANPEKLTLFQRSPVTSDQSEQGMAQIDRLMDTVAALRKGATSVGEKKHLMVRLKNMSSVLQKNRKGTVFLRVDENSLAGISFNTSKLHFVTSLMDEYDKLAKDFLADNPDLADKDDEGNTIDNVSIRMFDLAKSAGGNMSAVVKDASETLEQATHHIARGEFEQGNRYLTLIATQFKDSIENALKLQNGMLDENTEEMREIFEGMGIDSSSSRDQIEQAVIDIVRGHVSRRLEFYKKYQPDFTTRVGEGDVGKGDKADNLLIWTSFPAGKGIDKFVTEVNFQDLDANTQQNIIDNGGDPNATYFVAGTSLKTYFGGSKTTTGETYGFVGMGDRYDPGVALGDHERAVLNAMSEAGLSEPQIGAAREELRKLTSASRFCRDIVAGDSLQLRGKTPEESQKVVVNHLKMMMKEHNISMPLNDPEYFDRLRGEDGTIDTKSMSRFSTYLEKEMHMKIIDKHRDKSGELPNNSPMLHAILMLGVDAGYDSKGKPIGVMTNTKTNTSHVYDQNNEIMRPVREAISGDRKTQMTRGGLKVDGNFAVDMKNARNRVGISCQISSREEDLELLGEEEPVV